jgi:hypothetical protein
MSTLTATAVVKAKPVHGGETKAIRAARLAKMAELKELAKIIEGW